MNTTNPFCRRLDRLSRFSWAGLMWLLICIGCGVILVRADGPHQVGLVVAHGETVITRCIEFTEDELTGYQVLQRSGLDLVADVNSSMGVAVCRLDGTGCNFPGEDCFCRYSGSTAVFWSYWHLQADGWQFSNLGASEYKVRPGEVEGWRWGEGTSAGDGGKPPLIPFETICAAPLTSSPTPTATATLLPPTATATSLSTATPEPTATPMPQPTPAIHFFTADRTTISAGEGVNLTWDLSAADAAYLRYDGGEEGVVSPGSKTIFPTQTTRYSLVARKGDHEAIRELVVTVNLAAHTSTPDPANTIVGVTATATATPAAAPSRNPAPAETQPTFTAEAIALLPPTAAVPAIHFEAMTPQVVAGECTDLTWQTTAAATVFLDEAAVDLQGSHAVCPTTTTGYTLQAHGPGGESQGQVVVQVLLPTAQIRVATPMAATTIAAVVPTPGQVTVDQAVRPAASENRTASGGRWITYLGIGVVIVLFVLVPIGLLGLGGLAWWLRRR